MSLRITLRLALLSLAVLIFAGGGGLALASPAGAVAAVESPGKFAVLARLVIDHLDFVTAIIFICSIISLTYIIKGFMSVREKILMPESAVGRIREFITSRRMQELSDFVNGDKSFVSQAIAAGLRRAPRGFDQVREGFDIAVGEQTANEFRKIEILNIIGNLGPLLGLLGTVLGMIEAFDTMNRAGGNANAAQLASGIATALAHTFLGLFLAIPSLAAYGILRQRVDQLTTRAGITAEELLMMLKPAEQPAPRPPPQPAAAPH